MAAWVFKGNPVVFDVDAYLRTTNPITWTVGGPVKRFDRIRVGDRVFMFRAHDGVVAMGRAAGGPQPYGVEEPRVRAMWRKGSPKPDDLCIPVDIEEVRLRASEGMLRIGALRQHPVLAGLSVLKAGQGTTFAVTDEQERALLDLWRSRGGLDRTESG